MKPLVFILPGNEVFGNGIAQTIDAETGNYTFHRFPDGETYLRLLSTVEERTIIVVCTLHEPDTKIMPLLFLCKLLKEQKAKSICLVASYLAYMRQDKQFNPGEAITSVYFAQLLSSLVDKLITVDPHLHRRASMQEIYSIPCVVIHAAGLISQWIKKNISNALFIGPDSESEQWVSQVAANASAPFIVLQKIRNGDNNVDVSVPDVEKYKNYTPVLVDDIISTAHTMIETIHHLKAAGMKPPLCIGVHAVFAENAFKNLVESGAKQVITCNTIAHTSNQIDVVALIADALKNV
jgi:ribose-phosphate pyrophosphokinase